MSDLHIQLALPDRQTKLYVFNTFPVRIGRDRANHLPIDHAAVPRELCIAWLETDGQTIRVEERPGLTNPLLRGNTRVQGGVSGTSLHLKAGPAQLLFSTEPAAARVPKKKRALSPVWISAAGALILLIASGKPGARTNQEPDVFALLPKSPLCPPSFATCSGEVTCRARARLLRERAAETLSRRSVSLAERVHAIYQLQESVQLCVTADPKAHTQTETSLRAALKGLDDAYQQARMDLRIAVDVSDDRKIIDVSKDLKDTLGSCHPEAVPALTRLIEANLESLEVP